MALASMAHSTSNAAGRSSNLMDPSRIIRSLRSAPAGVWVSTLRISARLPFLAVLDALSSFSQSDATSLPRCFSSFFKIISSFFESFFSFSFFSFLPFPLSLAVTSAAAAAAAFSVVSAEAASSASRSFSLAQASRGSKVESGARLRRITGMRDLAFFFRSRREMMTQIMSVGEWVQYRSYMRSNAIDDCGRDSSGAATSAAATAAVGGRGGAAPREPPARDGGGGGAPRQLPEGVAMLERVLERPS
mmetsp:Transcript_47586/g.107951  ORF Transcript_47586/g.107951 Transcript_47586/m.107951 type:complete len:247 (-) Transcript_47586:102-842(-)